MIVKNEAHCISRCLNSVKDIIDYWIICDTGSTDNTREVVEKSLDGIPGEYHSHQWEDFSTNRNKSLELSRGKADYIFVIDADDYLTVKDSQVFSELDKSLYKIKFKHFGIEYSRIQLFNSSLDYKYIGVLHEYLQIPGSDFATVLDGCYINYGATGSRSKDPKKFESDAQLLERALLNNPGNSRDMFYCAQSYRDAGQVVKAIKYYEQRSKMGGWIEEIFISLLELGKLLEINNAPGKEIESTYLKAFNFLPSRVESLSYLCSYCRRHDEFNKAYFYSTIGIQIPKPKEGLFIELSCYNWKIWDELAISAYYIGKFQEAYEINKKILFEKDLPNSELDRIVKNLEFCEKENSY